MADVGATRKRKRPTNGGAGPVVAGKRDQSGSTLETTLAAATGAQPHGRGEAKGRKKRTAMQRLKWRSSTLPAFDSAMDGFLGLEEIDGVDVLAETVGGTTRYRLKDAPSGGDAGSDDELLDADAEFDSDFVDDEDGALRGAAQEDEFTGFDDAPSAAEPAARAVKRAADVSTRRSAQSTASDADAAQTTAHPTRNAFELLADDLSENDAQSDASTSAGRESTPTAWTEFRLHENILRALAEMSFRSPTAIQRLALPRILAGDDVIGKAATGSGKTLAFGLPIIEDVLADRRTGIASEALDRETDITALVLSPTRELAQQITAHLESAARYAGVRIVTVTGGLSIQKQQRQLRRRVDVVVATPGRLWELMQVGGDGDGDGALVGRLARLRYLVVDEADRVLQEGHFAEVESIIGKLPRDNARQTCVFSATFARELQGKLVHRQRAARQDTQAPRRGQRRVIFPGGTSTESDLTTDTSSLSYLLRKLRFRRDPYFLDASPAAHVSADVVQGMIECGPLDKDYHLYHLLLRYPCRTLVFTNSIDDVRRLAETLAALGIRAGALHGDKQQKARLKALERFRADKAGVLIASDVASRGLDIPDVQCVVHYHLPRTADLYVHRSGRTARAGERGVSVLLCSPKEVTRLRRMGRKLGIVTASGTKGDEGGDELRAFPVDAEAVGRCKPRVNLARDIVKAAKELDRLTREAALVAPRRPNAAEDSAKKRGGKNAWLLEAAEDLGLTLSDLSDDNGDGEENGARSRKRQKQRKAGAAPEHDGPAPQNRRQTEERRKLQARLDELRAALREDVARPIQAGGFSAKFLTKGADNVAHRLVMQQLAEEAAASSAPAASSDAREASVRSGFVGVKAVTALQALLRVA